MLNRSNRDLDMTGMFRGFGHGILICLILAATWWVSKAYADTFPYLTAQVEQAEVGPDCPWDLDKTVPYTPAVVCDSNHTDCLFGLYGARYVNSVDLLYFDGTSETITYDRPRKAEVINGTCLFESRRQLGISSHKLHNTRIVTLHLGVR